MTDQLTLTGATMVSSNNNKKKNDVTDLELGGSENKNVVVNGSQKAVVAAAANHNHNHKGCCAKKVAPPIQVVFNAPSKDEISKASVENIRTSLITMIRFGGYDEAFVPMMKLLLEHRPSAQTEIIEAIGCQSDPKKIPAGSTTDNDNDHYSLVHWAAKRDDTRFLRYLCNSVSDPSAMLAKPSTDKVAMHPLHWCATAGSIRNASCLLEYGADLESTDGAGCTPLLIASQYGHVNLVAYLLQKGANGRAVDLSRDSALHWAAYKGSIQVCGHLLFRKELQWTAIDAYGQTPLHLASLRGHTPVVRYLIEEGTRDEAVRVMQTADKNGKTPLNLAVTKKRPTVELVLRDYEEKYIVSKSTVGFSSCLRSVRQTYNEFCSLKRWKIWLGIAGGGGDEVDVAPIFPLYFVRFHMFLYTLWFPFIFTPVFNTSEGILWDYSGWLFLNMISCALMWFVQIKVTNTDPGCLDENHPETAHYRRLYEQTIEAFGSDSKIVTPQQQRALCHTCHIMRPIRSKHCRNARRCVLNFDHHCPFVGATIGLNNYSWFYATLFFMTTSCIGFIITLFIYLSRRFSYTILFMGIELSLIILLAGGMCLYHTQLTTLNLTTNEHMNLHRYEYLQSSPNERRDGMKFGPQGRYFNPFYRGWFRNTIQRFNPTKQSYTLLQQTNDREDDENNGNKDNGTKIDLECPKDCCSNNHKPTIRKHTSIV
eukprot:CAMPEP_0194130414 /NCGR_PEP_ID=MMETSP0152-20130528/1455_1 /TAXON_ID=1049557 /ORGANISM="Thalassiothrix antarctica, Strain L6-D1" /LENGTH=708 /DNA_ID=CAMNT_0038824921 /DNA_START=398 /DNA_END=2524 /DNA_ORIENTATION=-